MSLGFEMLAIGILIIGFVVSVVGAVLVVGADGRGADGRSPDRDLPRPGMQPE